MSAEGGYNVSGFYDQNKTVWAHVAATLLGSTRSVTFYTDMAPPLVSTPASVSPKFVRKEGGQNVFAFSLQPGQAVLLQPAGALPLPTPYTVKPVSWPTIDGKVVENFWGKHYRAVFPPGPAPSPPHPHPRPPSPPPAPAPTLSCDADKAPEGYTCVANACNSDHGKVNSCGADICNPDEDGAMPPAVVALCAEVDDAHGNATAVAAAQCNAYSGCHSFAAGPAAYSPSQRRCPTKSGSVLPRGVCFKFFRSGAANQSSSHGWTLYAK